MRLYAIKRDWPRIELYHGDSVLSAHDADLVLTNPYGPIPTSLHMKPMILTGKMGRQPFVEELCGNRLRMIGTWGDGGDEECIWVANLPMFDGQDYFDLPYLNADKHGFWPLELPIMLLEAAGFDCRDPDPAFTSNTPVVWDGFMGRGTAGTACQILGLHYIGIDHREDRCELAREYLELERA